MKGKVLARLGLVLVVSALVLLSPPRPARAEEVCILWNIQGRWLYRASGGGHGFMDILQDPDGKLRGSWYNEGNGASGTFTDGKMEGMSFGLMSSSRELLQGVVDPDGRRISGSISGATVGTWEATGSATCLQRQQPLPAGSCDVQVKWGQYVFHSDCSAEAYGTRLLQQSVRVTRINTGNGTVLLNVQVTIPGDQPLPPTLAWTQTVDNNTVVTGVLTLVPGTRTYTGVIAVNNPGDVTRVRGTNPVTNRPFTVAMINQFLIDPAGMVYDSQNQQPIEGAMATLYKRVGGTWTFWPAEKYQNQMNPQVTDPSGHYSWMTDDGQFKVEVSKEGYKDGTGGPVTVPPPATNVNIALVTTTIKLPEIADLVMIDERGIPTTTFSLNQKARARLTFENDTGADAQVTLTWSTTDPQGQALSSFSGSKSYYIGQFPLVAILEGQIPATAPDGSYTFRVEVSKEGVSAFKGTTFWVHGISSLFIPALTGAQGSHPLPTLTTTQMPTPTPTQTPSPTPTTTPPAEQTIMQEGFEGSWPTGRWEVFEDSDTDGGEFFWGVRDCRAFGGSHSIWAVGGGRNGSALSCTLYPNNAFSWAVYGPFDLSDATAAKLTFQVWNKTEREKDTIFWGASKDGGDNFSGWVLSGDTRGWKAYDLDLANVPTIGSCLGLSQVYIAFVFRSDAANQYEGAYVDDVLLTKKTSGTYSAGCILMGGQEGLSPATLKLER